MKRWMTLCAWMMAASLTAVAEPLLTPGTGVANDHGGNGTSRDIQFVPRSTETGYGYRSYVTGLGFTVLPWSIPNRESTVYGVRTNLGWGYFANSTGLDTGLFSHSGYCSGLQINVFGNLTDSNSDGLHIGLVNVVGRRQRGLQIGLVNYADYLEGVQIGLLNFTAKQCSLPILNIAW